MGWPAFLGVFRFLFVNIMPLRRVHRFFAGTSRDNVRFIAPGPYAHSLLILLSHCNVQHSEGALECPCLVYPCWRLPQFRSLQCMRLDVYTLVSAKNNASFDTMVRLSAAQAIRVLAAVLVIGFALVRLRILKVEDKVLFVVMSTMTVFAPARVHE